MSWTELDYSFGGNATFGAPGQQYQVVTSLPTPTNSLVGNLFYVIGPPGELWVLRLNAQGNLVYVRYDGRTCILQLNFSTANAPSTAIVPYDISENILVSTAWTVVDIVFRQEVTGTTASSLQIARSTGTGVFTNVGYLNTVAVTIATGAYEQTTRPALLTVTTVNSGDKLQAVITPGTGASGFSVYLLLRETN